MKKGVAFMLVLFVLVGLSGCSKKEQNIVRDIPELLEPVGVQMDMAPAQINEVYEVKTYNGVVVPYVEELSFLVDGTLEEIKVSLGEWVTEGQVLACLSEENISNQIDKLNEEIADIIKMGEFNDRQMKADIEIAKIELLNLQEGGTSVQAFKLKEVDVQKLEKKLEQAIELRELDLQERQRELMTLKEKLGSNQITAPFSGRVAYVSDVARGDEIQGFTTIMCLADESRLHLETDFFPESVIQDADKVYAKIQDTEYNIDYIPYDVRDYIKKVVNGEEVKTQFSIHIGEGEVESGQFAVVMIFSSYKENVLTIPKNALYHDAGGHYVYKLTEGKRARCNVTVGIVTNTRVEIKEGLQEGDLVYVKE